MRLELHHVAREPAARQDPAVHVGVQRLHAAAEDLGEAGEVYDRPDRDLVLAEQPGGAAGGDDLDVQRREPARQLHDSRLV